MKECVSNIALCSLNSCWKEIMEIQKYYKDLNLLCACSLYIQFQYIHWFWDTNLKCVYTQFWQSCARQINYHHQSSVCGSLSTVTLHNAPLHCTGLGFPPLLASFRGLVSVSPHSERGVISWPGRTMQTSVTSVICPAQTNQYCPAQWSTVITRASRFVKILG